MTFWSNLIGYQVVWFTAVIGASHGKTLPSLLVGGAFVLWQILTADNVHAELRLLVVAMVLGVIIDGVLARTGWANYASSPPSFPARGAPLWILTLWLSFAMTLNRSLAYLRDRWWLALLLGAIGAPLAYLGAQRGWHAVVFQPPSWHGIVWIACSWAIALPLLALLARHWTTTNAAKPARVQVRK